MAGQRRLGATDFPRIAAMPSGHHDLVHFNVALAKYPIDHPAMAGFASQITAVNELAERSAGFVWMATDEEAGDAAAVFGSALALANMSTWRSVRALQQFVYHGPHGQALSRRDDWFETAAGPTYVLWWVPAGHRPNWAEAKQRLQTLAERGPTPDAFTFASAFGPDGQLLATS